MICALPYVVLQKAVAIVSWTGSAAGYENW